jgi:hypothetical protein
MLSLAAVALVLSLQASGAPLPERRYADELRRGVAALAAGERATASAAFGAAGALAPEAPLWRLYLAVAEQREVTPRAPEPPPGGHYPWRFASDYENGAPRFSPGGDHVVGNRYRACIWDGLSGERISESTEYRRWWSFERTGRYLFGNRVAERDFKQLDSIEVRRLSTGEPACAPLRIGQRVSEGAIMSWSDDPFDAARAVGDGPWLLVRRVALDGGTLTAHIPRYVDVNDRNTRVELRSDAKRALLEYVRFEDRVRRSYVVLVDSEDPEPLVTVTSEWGGASFSSDGALVLTGIWKGPLRVHDAETGAELAAPTGLQMAAVPGDPPRVAQPMPIVAQGGVLYVPSPEQVRTWDPRTGAWTRTVTLSPSLADFPQLAEDTPTLFVLERARALAFGSYHGIAVYDADSGKRLWSREAKGMMSWDGAWHESPAGSRIVLEGPGGLPLVLDARTGEPTVALHAGTTAAKSVVHFEIDAGAPEDDASTAREGALVAVANGSLRAFELSTGHSLGRSELHLGREIEAVHVGVTGDATPMPAAVTWDDGGRVVLWELPALVPRAQLDVEAGATIRAASVAAGCVVLTRAEVDGRTPVELRRIDGGELVTSVRIGSYIANAVSDDGQRIALVDAMELLVLDAWTGAEQVRIALTAPPVGKHEGACSFHGPDFVALGWGSYDLHAPGVGLDVYDLRAGVLAGRHQPTGFSLSLGGWVGAIESMRDAGRLAYSISACGLVYLLEDRTWTKVAELDYRGGNESVLDLSHAPGSARLFISGMSGANARMVSTNTFEVRARESVVDLFDLCESPGGRYVVGLTSGRVHVLDGSTLARLYERQELTGPGARLIRSGKELVDLGVGPRAAQDCHIERGGSTHPLACFDAWLLDPLGLGRVTLEHLPQPPRVDTGPQRRVKAGATSVTLHFDALDERGLIGAWVLAAGRTPRFLPIDAATDAKLSREEFSAILDGPWPLDVELVAVGRTGLESKPWRVRIEPTE